MDSKKLTELISEHIFSKKGYEVRILDLRKLTTIADFFVICSADSDTQVKAIADEVTEKLKEEGIKCWQKEGYNSLNWVLLDYVDVVVHIFKHESRLFYSLERLWGDAPTLEVEDPLLQKKKKSVKTKKQL